jgi:hypothetical protein
MEIIPNPHVALNNARNLRSIFPRGSKSFFEANEIKTDHPSQTVDTKRHKKAALERPIPRKKESLGRITLSYRICRVRPLDPDGLASCTKNFTDGLRRCGLIPGDDPFQIRLEVEQEQVSHFADECIKLEIIWTEERT